MNLTEARRWLNLDASHFSLPLIKDHYRREISKWHPDRHTGDQSIRAEYDRSKKINEAYEVLTELVEKHVAGATDSQASVNQEYSPQHRYRGKIFTPGFPDETVLEEFVKSSHIVSVGYSRALSRLYIKFDGDRVYEYFDVPEPIYLDFVGAESPGRFANRFIYERFEYHRCEEPNRPFVGRRFLQ